ncbi:MAG: methionyl-tRNA formyltransferase [Patescibacteria group bacterium]
MENKEIIDFAFFGTSSFSTKVLDVLTAQGYYPSLLITTPDRPAGRGMKLSSSPLKEWGKEKDMPVFQPESLNNEETLRRIRDMAPNNKRGWDVFIVASYGKMLPANIVNDPIYKSLNVHPSLLPRLRGSSPIQSAILHEDTTGVTIIRMDEQMDHGPIVAQEEIKYKDWPPDAPTLERDLAKKGGEVLAEVLPKWTQGEIKEEPQDDREATYTQMIKKEDAFLDIENESPQVLFRKIKAYKEKPKAYFFYSSPKKGRMRIIVTEAEYKDGRLNIKRVIPEGKKEMEYKNFLQSQN